MKRIITTIFIVCMVIGLCCSCDPYADDIEAMQRRIAELELQLEETEEGNTTERQKLQDEIDRLRDKVGDLDTRVTTLEELIARVTTLEANVNELTTAVESLDDEVFGEDGLSELVEAYNKALKVDVADLKLKVDDLEEACDTLANNVKANKTNINVMSGELNKLIVDFDTLKAKYEMAVESDISDHYHLNANGEIEAHTYGD